MTTEWYEFPRPNLGARLARSKESLRETVEALLTREGREDLPRGRYDATEMAGAVNRWVGVAPLEKIRQAVQMLAEHLRNNDPYALPDEPEVLIRGVAESLLGYYEALGLSERRPFEKAIGRSLWYCDDADRANALYRTIEWLKGN